MISREYVSGFLMGVSISLISYGIYLKYIDHKLNQLSKTMTMTMTMNEPEVIELNDMNNNSDVD